MVFSHGRAHARGHPRAATCAVLLGLALVMQASSAGASSEAAGSGRLSARAVAAGDAARLADQVNVTMTDLGTLGDGARAEAISDRGVVIGVYAGQDVGRAFRWADGVMVDLVDRAGGHGGDNHAITDAIAVNARGQVVGTSTLPDGLDTRAVLWEPNGTIVQLETTGSFSTALAINRTGTVAGGMRPSPDGDIRAVIWRDGVMTDLGDLGGGWSVATAINDVGEVTGASGDASGATRAFHWRDGTMTALPIASSTPPDARTGGPLNINRRGDVLGLALLPDPDDPEQNIRLGLLWDRAGAATLVPGLGGPGVRPADLNDRGQVVGAADTADGAVHAFLAEDGSVIDLGTLGGRDSEALALNRREQVVGSSDIPNDPFQYRATLWDDGTVIDLGAIGRASQAVDINRRGEIVGWSLDANRPECSDVRPRCGEHAMLWTVDW